MPDRSYEVGELVIQSADSYRSISPSGDTSISYVTDQVTSATPGRISLMFQSDRVLDLSSSGLTYGNYGPTTTETVLDQDSLRTEKNGEFVFEVTRDTGAATFKGGVTTEAADGGKTVTNGATQRMEREGLVVERGGRQRTPWVRSRILCESLARRRAALGA